MKKIADLLNSIDNKVLMTVFPHPDDETMATGGLLQAAKSLGWKTIVVSVTAGGAGQIHMNGNGKPLVGIRKLELGKAAKILGVDSLEIGDFDDGKLKTKRGWQKWVDGVINEYRPGLVVTYDPSGLYGHPDHIAVSKMLLDNTLSGPPLTLRGGRVSYELLFVAVPKEFRDKLKLRGMDQVKENMVDPTHVLYLGWKFINKWRAMKAHRSQRLRTVWPVEYYHLVEKGRKYVYKYIHYDII